MIFHRYQIQYSNHCNSGTSIASDWRYFCSFYYNLCTAVAQQQVAPAPINPNFGGPFNPIVKQPQPQINPTAPPIGSDFKSFIQPPPGLAGGGSQNSVGANSAGAQSPQVPAPIWPGLGSFGGWFFIINYVRHIKSFTFQEPWNFNLKLYIINQSIFTQTPCKHTKLEKKNVIGKTSNWGKFINISRREIFPNIVSWKIHLYRDILGQKHYRRHIDQSNMCSNKKREHLPTDFVMEEQCLPEKSTENLEFRYF